MGLASIFPTARTDLVSRTVDGEVVILDRAQQFVHQLNVTASLIWVRCDGATPVTGIAEHFATDVRCHPDDVLADVCEAIAEFEKLGLLAQAKRR